MLQRCTHIKKKLSFQKRLEESTRIMDKYPNRIPIYVYKGNNSLIPDIDRKKYLVPHDLTIGQFMHVIRKRMSLNHEVAIYLFINGMIPASSNLLISIYNEHKDDDGFLYITYSGESTFG